MQLYKKSDTALFKARDPLGQEVGLEIETRSTNDKAAQNLGVARFKNLKKQGIEPSLDDQDRVLAEVAFKRCVGWRWYGVSEGKEKKGEPTPIDGNEGLAEFSKANFDLVIESNPELLAALISFQGNLANFME